VLDERAAYPVHQRCRDLRLALLRGRHFPRRKTIRCASLRQPHATVSPRRYTARASLTASRLAVIARRKKLSAVRPSEPARNEGTPRSRARSNERSPLSSIRVLPAPISTKSMRPLQRTASPSAWGSIVHSHDHVGSFQIA